MRRFSILLFTLFVFLAASAVAQDLIDQEGTPITGPNINFSWPRAAVAGNGETGLFAMFFGGSSGADGILFRKLDAQGKPLGNQRIVYETNYSETFGFLLTKVIYADNNYYLLVHNRIQNSILLFKFNINGKFISKTRYKFAEKEFLRGYYPAAVLFGDSIYISVTTSEYPIFSVASSDKNPGGDRKTENYLLKADLNDLKKFSRIDLLAPTNKLRYSFGVSRDADRLVILTAEYSNSYDYEFLDPAVVSYDPVSEDVSNLVFLDSHKELNNYYSQAISRPVYNGKGHLFFYASRSDGEAYYSFMFDNMGTKLSGPTDINENGSRHIPYQSDLVGSFAFFGNYDPSKTSVLAMILGPKGKHVNNIYYAENRGFDFLVDSLGQVFTGNNVVFYYIAYVGSYGGSTRTYSKSTPTPSPIKDGISFFQAGSKNFKDGSRHLIWSTVGSESVTIKHDGKEYNNLPPYYSFQLPNVNVNKPVELTFTSAAGKTYTRRVSLK